MIGVDYIFANDCRHYFKLFGFCTLIQNVEIQRETCAVFFARRKTEENDILPMIRSPRAAASSRSCSDRPESLSEDFRHSLRRFGNGVTIVATVDRQGQPRGLMMTAVMSLCMEPPSMLIAVNRAASALPFLLERGRFSINIIGAGEEEECARFARADAETRFVNHDWDCGTDNIPRYRRAAATIICDIDDARPFGSHMVIQGLVRESYYAKEIGGLVYLDGRFFNVKAGG
ncbi:flavin reductase (DIM6/NTAB) family NADH-FMN oxidoreductase RutF [Altererythrobacter atlanticus]|uniref:NADH:FAD oxidoreductase n=1 Tax=Croceibacterium atlanticum TaxID=1267766 RepID=A0A0F7KLH3_9SPHN|nr:flavin reductase family protein [Croceibacterium atlanticum]AKH41393.1 NADH:FAD oxidoreductase [Croceibacterium atlanticum]MBB5732855.1 flavin reductase (DIM6/NTAB) family NADH-FMN oxidoreductase RutF [Croceibacterium atlanticum]